MSFGLSIREIDQMIYEFKSKPSRDTYETVMEWYVQQTMDTADINSQDPEHVMCVYIFLLAANLRHLYTPIGKDEFSDYIVQIRDLVQGAEPIYRGRRKMYLDCGTAK
jgi:hypothetical protein